MNLPDIRLDNPSMHKFIVKTTKPVEEFVQVEKEFIIDGNAVKGTITESIIKVKEVDIEVQMIADHISNYEISHEPHNQRLAVRYTYGFYNNGIFKPSTDNNSIVFNGAGYRSAGMSIIVTPTDVLQAIMKYQKISGTIVS